MKEIKATVDVQNGGMRLDAFWQGILESEGVARTRVQSWIWAGRAQVDGRECRKPSLKLVPGQRLSLEPEEILSGLEPVSGDLDVVFADEHMLVINKTANLIVHPAPSVDEPTLVHHLAHAFPHFQSGLVRERNGQDAFRTDAFVHHVGNAAGDGARFSRSRSGQDQDRPLKGLNGPALGRVQAFHGK